jgi:hypothetical protein
MNTKSLTLRGTILPALALTVAVASPLDAATLADWRFNEAGSGLVDAPAGFQSTFAAVPGAPFAPVLNHASATPGNDPRDLVRLRADDGLWNYRNAASYRTLSGTLPYIGYSGTPSYWGSYAQQDGRATYYASDGTDIVSTRDPDVFSNSDLSGGFTAQVVWRPGIQSDPSVTWLTNFDPSGQLRDNTYGYLFSIEAFVQIYYTDANPAVGAVDPRLVFAINGSDPGSMLSVPFDGAFFLNRPSWFEHTVAIYNPAGPDKLLLYRDGVLVATSATGTLGNLNTYTGFYPGETTVGSPPSYYPVPGKALIDQIVIANDILIKTGDATPQGWVIPEPSLALWSVLGAAFLLRRRQ